MDKSAVAAAPNFLSPVFRRIVIKAIDNVKI
jgi:hypothetical protein